MARKRKPSAQDVAELVSVEARYATAKSDLKELEDERRGVRDRLAPFFVIGEEIEVHGVRVKLGESDTGERFDFKAVKAAGHKLPPYLRKFVKPPKPYTTWQVKPAEKAVATA